MTTYKDILCRKMKNTEYVKAVKKINKNDIYQYKSVKAHLIESSINSSTTRASIVSSIEQPQQPVAKKYGEILYNILYDYYKDNCVSRRHPERISMVVDKLLESDIEELEEFMTNRLCLEDCADEIFTVLHYQLDPPIPGVIYNI
jgi:hypothetical protein